MKQFLKMFESEGSALDGGFLYESIRRRNELGGVKGRQEDAQEFLGFLLDGIHQELTLLNNNNGSNNNGVDGAWQDVGKKNKVLEQVVKQTDIIQLFGGRLHSVVQHKNKKTVSFEPFLILSLPIISRNLIDCLQDLTKVERIEGTQGKCINRHE